MVHCMYLKFKRVYCHKARVSGHKSFFSNISYGPSQATANIAGIKAAQDRNSQY